VNPVTIAPPALQLPGLSAPTLPDAAARRRWLLDADDAELADAIGALVHTHRGPARTDGAGLAAFLGTLHGEVVASPFCLRACAMGAATGSAMVHHELRQAWRWDPALLADIAVADDDHGAWTRGILHVGRYEGFGQDLPLGSFDPNHSSRWSAHELLHRACGFYFEPGISAWKLYLGARLAEIVPVAHWYGTDLIWRLDVDGFDRATDLLDAEAPVARAAWLRADADMIAARAANGVAFLRTAARWVDAELAAVRTELSTGATVPVDDPLLDSVSDAIAYATGHHRRLNHPLVGAIVAAMAEPGVARSDSVAALADHVEASFDTLVFGTIAVDPERAAAARSGRLLWDLCLRAALCDPQSCAEALGDDLAEYAALARAAQRGHAGPQAAAAVRDVAGRIADVGLHEVFPLGLHRSIDPVPPQPRTQLAAGIAALCPDLIGAIGQAGGMGPEDAAIGFADTLDDRAVWRRAHLADRLVDALQDAPLQLRAHAVLSRAIHGATARDDVIERLAAPPQTWQAAPESGFVRRSTAFSVVSLAGDEADPDPYLAAMRWLVGGVQDAIAVLPYPPAVQALWEALADGPMPAASAVELLDMHLDPDAADDGWPTDAVGWVHELASAGALGWLS